MASSNPGISPPRRVLLGAGPSSVHPLVRQALAAPIVGHMDPYFYQVMQEAMALLRGVFRTANPMTFPISGTGSAGMEAAMSNLLEPGDKVIIGVNGYFGQRMVEMASRCGAQVIQVAAPWGSIIPGEAIEAALKQHARVKVLALVHAETSTGVLQPLAEACRLAREYGVLLLVDTVTSLGGCEVAVDPWGVDVCYSATQKCLGCPPGLAPITLSPRAMEAVRRRQTKVNSWYLDVSLLESYWLTGRVYHHTAPISMVYALREALRLLMEEGLEAGYERHWRNGTALQRGLEAMGLQLLAPTEHRAPMLTAVCPPPGVDAEAIRRALLEEYDIEVGGGLGELRGKLWRIGLMGYSSQGENVLAVLSALESLLARAGWGFPRGDGVAAAGQVLNRG